MKKQVIRLTEGDLHKIIKESVNKIIMESNKTFDERLEQELQMPYEARASRMTDEEITQLLNQHKQEQMDYDEQQMALADEKRFRQGMPKENPNLNNDNSKFSASNQYVHGFMNVPNK